MPRNLRAEQLTARHLKQTIAIAMVALLDARGVFEQAALHSHIGVR